MRGGQFTLVVFLVPLPQRCNDQNNLMRLLVNSREIKPKCFCNFMTLCDNILHIFKVSNSEKSCDGFESSKRSFMVKKFGMKSKSFIHLFCGTNLVIYNPYGHIGNKSILNDYPNLRFVK